ncbi:hypothetical protein HK105_203513 [Polyrhizophydium stewartii]|uniref:Carrier domain-containing protein n=1 Tax=Polyrhizophydium stewartii TaxID=2732419 RepID=A0ABR4NC23_9FUNG
MFSYDSPMNGQPKQCQAIEPQSMASVSDPDGQPATSAAVMSAAAVPPSVEAVHPAPDPRAAFCRSQLGASPPAPLSLGGPRTPPGLVPPPAPRTVPLPTAVGLSTSAVTVAAAATIAKFKRSSDVVVGIDVAGTDPAARTIVPVRIVLDDSAAIADAVAAAAESIRAATQHSPVDLAQVRAWCGLSPSDPVCDVVLCIGKVSNASLEANFISTGAAIALAVDTSANSGSVTSIHDDRMLDEDQAASVVNEFAFTVSHLVSTLADKGTVESLLEPGKGNLAVEYKSLVVVSNGVDDMDIPNLAPAISLDKAAARTTETKSSPASAHQRHRRRAKNFVFDFKSQEITTKSKSIGHQVAAALALNDKFDESQSFAEAGGDSLAAIRLAAEVQTKGVALTAIDLMSGRPIKEIIEAASKRDVAALTWPEVSLNKKTLAELAAVGSFVDAYPATPLQAGMVAATMQDARAYVNQVPLRATRTVSLESLRGALRAVVQHHAILRTSFVSTVAGGIVQVVRASADAAECVAVAAPLAQHLAADKARGFSLTEASWIRAALVCDPAGSAQHVVVTIHHALYDGWSLPMIMRDLVAALDGHALEPRPAFRTVVDFIAAQDAAATEAFWTQQLVGLEPAQPLSLGHSARTDDEDAPLAQACSTPMAELQRAAQRAGVTVAVVLKAAWAATLRKFTRSHDVVFGEVLANRDIAVGGADRIVGPLLNTVPCRVVLDDTVLAADLVASLQAQHGAVLSHSHAALVDVQQWAGIQGDGKLFNTLFVYQGLDFEFQPDKFEFVGEITNALNRSADFDLLIFPGKSHIRFEALWTPHLSRSQAASILAEFDFGVQQLVTALSDKATVESLWTLSPSQQSMIARFSHGERVPLPFELVHHGFEARAKQHPDWRAVEHGDAHLSYGDLDACGCALAAALASHGVQRGSRVAVVMQRSIEFVVALVGVLKAGATIVPVDSSFPADRIQFMLDDASVCAIVTTASEADRIAQLSVGDRAVVVADARALLASGVSFVPAAEHTVTGDDDAFIVYTSGTTGRPKGVPIRHQGIVNVAMHCSPLSDFVEHARVPQFMAIGFDVCVWEVWGSLSNGSTLVMRTESVFDSLRTVDALVMTPTGLRQLGSPTDWPRLKAVTVTGEVCSKELKDLWSPHVRFVNGGCPSEATIVAVLGVLSVDDPVYYGKPIANMSCYIMDSRDCQVPVGVVGEMCLGGIGVSRGYINLPDLTAQRFVPDPFSPEPGARMFRTGDLGRLLPDGNFEILGRMDDQVKLKGYRIELDEVAAAMMRHPRVSAAAAVVKDKTHLVGFVVPADVDHDELRDVVAAALPAYMVPAVFVGLAVMPTNTNGKTDKKALAAMHVEIAVDSLQTDTEHALAAVWSQVLGVQVADIGRATSFFALGGDSISAIRLVAKAKQQGLTLSSALIFKAPTLAKMALAATVSETRAVVSSAPVTGSVALTPIQHMFFAHDWINISHFNQSFVVKPRDTLDIAALTAAIARLAEHHDMLRARFAQGDDGAWSQTLLPLSPQTDAENVLAVVVETDDDALACVREAQESLSITHGPLLAVRLLHMHDGSQRLFFGIHHLVVDLVSWRVLLDDLEMLLRGRPLAPKTLSFQAWAARMAAHAATLDAAPWRDLIGDHTTLLATQPPAAGVPVRAFHAHAVLDEATTAQLDAANAPFNTNIQELVLAALVLSLADVAGCASSPAQLCIELEGHGREPFAADLDVSSTVGWFTSVFPVAFSASTASDIGAVVRQVKHKIRSVPLKGLSYGMIKHLAPPTADNAFVKAHGGHAVAFNYLGRFQSLEAEDAYFVADSDVGGYWSVRHEDRRFHAIELSCAHDGPRLVLSATVEDWIVSEPTMQAWLDRWQVWMQRVVAHCVDPATHGGRTVSDVPLMASQAAVEQAEAELANVLSLRARDIVDMYPVTPLQAGFLSAMMRDPSEYTVQSAFDVTGNMDVQRLRAAWHAVAMAHPIVRTVFVSTPSGLVQAVAKDDRTEWTELDGVWTADDDALQAATAALMAADRARGFSMASVSFHRFTVVRIADGRMRVFWTQHHSVSDGWSLPLLIADLMRACAGTAIAAPRAQFRDHVEWLLMQDAAASERFWRESLVHAAESGRLAPPKPRASELSGAKYGELRAVVELPRLAAVCKTHGVTVSTVLRLAWALVLRHFTRSEHIVFGSVVSGRDGSIDGIDQAVGVLINTIAVPSHLPLDASAASALVAMQSFSADAITHSHVGLVDVQRAAGVVGSDRLFDTLMVFENYPSSNAGVPLDFALTPVSSKEFVDSTVTAVFAQSENAIATHMSFECGNVPTWFAHSMMDKLIDVLRRLCSADGDFATTTVADMDALTESQQSMIARFSHGERVPLPFALVHHGFEARAKQHPDWRAVEHGDAHLSYGDLDACGSALAAALASHGVQCGSRVAVVMQRSIEFVVALVGVLKAGATIVPVDSSFPADRIQFMLDDASVCAIVTTASEAGRIAQLSVGDRAVVVADARALLASGVSFTPAAQRMAAGDDDAFIVYTSGSTGKPKGVPVPHKGAVNIVALMSPKVGIVEGARYLQMMAVGFDAFQWEVFGSLAQGATLLLRTESLLEVAKTATSTHPTPTGLRHLGSPSQYPLMKHVTTGGEACPSDLKDLWAGQATYTNVYGPTEISIISHFAQLKVGEMVTIGRPVPNASCYIFDVRGHEVPVGVVGEMCLGGIGVSRGYINLPDLTAQRFVPDPFSPEPGARILRTGDLGRLLPDGNFEILGRMDDQVKLKGYRIELDEVAAAMMRHPRVSAAAAVVKDKTHLVGFVVPADVDHDELRDVVAAALPAYMVPAVFVGLAVMPTNTNGKTDKKALAAMHVEIAVDALQTDTERALAAVWSQVLGVQVADIGRATSFFALGGDSISAIKAAAAMQRAGISITVPQLFKAQTVARVAALADAADAHDGHRSATEWPAAVLSDETLAELAAVGSFDDAYPATPLQAGMVAATMQDARAYVNQVPLRATRTVSLESLRGALRAVVQHHAILRTSFVSTVAGGIVQVVRASADAAECVAVAAPLAQHLAADKARGFSLADASWIRAALVCDPAGSAQHVVVTIHHALYDGWSLPMIMRDLAAALDGHALEPRPAFRTVVDFIAAQDAAATEAFWTQQLVGLEPAQPLSLGHSARTDDEDAPLAQACSTPMAELQRAAQRAGVTVAVVLKAAWAATLRKFTRSHDVVFGEVLANRDIAVGGADRIVGPLLNTVPCRVVLDDTARAADLVASLQAQHGAVLSHSHAALVDVQRWAGVQGDGKLFNTLFVFENLPDDGSQSGDTHKLALSGDVSSTVSSKSLSYSFELILHPSSTRVESVALFDHSHLSRSQAASILAEFDFGVQQLVTALSDKATVESLWTLSPGQQAAIARFSHGERVPLPFSLVHHGFEARAKQHPDWRAVEHGDAHLSYGDLDACGSALAATLASHGMQRGSRVAVVMQRSIEFVVALVGVLKAGATIVPVDSSFPADRIQFMLDDASVCAIVTTASEAGRIAQLSVGDRAVVVADARALLASGVSFMPAAQHMATSDDDFAIIYTSGTTGKPKGVPLPHKGVVNVIHSQIDRIGCIARGKHMQFMAVGFDGFQHDVWSALSIGSTLLLRKNDSEEVLKTATSINITPTGLSMLGAPYDFRHLKTISVAGEACPIDLKNIWSTHVQFSNFYGPTETSIMTHSAILSVNDQVVIGRVIDNASSYILDLQSRQVPVGVVGEMCLGGIGVSRGYINLPDLTAQRFVPDPFSPEPGARMFRTGDLGRLLPDGNFEILGRMDDQVKLKGYRIELDEVAAAMMRHPRVSAAAAVVKDKTHLVGFVVPADVDHDELRDVVAAALPAYMVPAVFVGLAVMPTNTNGKTDKKALAAMHVEIAVDELQTDTERALAAVWSQVLGVQVADIGRATSFFALGGDSISAIKAAAAMQRAGISITVPHLFKAQTVARVAALADAADAHVGQRVATEWPAAVLSDDTLAELAAVGSFVDAYPATPLQAGMVAATMQDARAYVNQVPLRATRTVSLESLRGAFRAVVQHHAILRTSFVSTVAGGIVQVVRASADAAECVAVAAPLAQHLAADKARGLALADASWIRAALVCDPAGSAQHVVVTIHHALYDGWSLPMIMRDLAAALDGHALEPRPAFRTVVDFIAAQDAAATEAFWTQQLVGLEPAQPLSLGHSARTDDEDAPLAQACSTPMAELQRAAQRAGVTVAVVLKAAWAATLRKFTRSHDVVFGEVLANRDIAVAGADRIVGPLLNTVPCRVVLDDTVLAADLVASLQAQHGAVLSHSHAALVDVQRWAGVQGDGKLFNTLFVFENLPDDGSQKESIALFDHSHLSRSQAASILAEFDFGVQQLVSALSDKATVESLWTLSPAQQAMIARFSHGERVPLPFALVHHGFEARAKQHPDWRAVEHGDAHLSYGDLDACGSALAAALASHGVQRGSRVAVVMQRSIEFVVALVGVLKAGATIVPVDSSFPADRIQFMLDDASVCAIVTTASEAGRIAQLSVGDRAVVVADARALLASGVSFTPAAQHTATGDDDAFIVYTSGSTGKPKGVPVPHKGVVNVVSHASDIGCTSGARMAQFMAIGFDVCQWETCSDKANQLFLARSAYRRTGISSGYINLPDLTAQRFVPDPFSPEPGARMFRTGDLGRLLPDGNFEILGRMDDQVKLKGYRIELDEVAAAMMRHPRVSAAAAVVKDKTHLVGFVVPADVDHDELRDVVAAALPAYMVPAVFVGLAVMPTNTNGKTDKKALAAMHVEIAVDALQTDTERALAAVWSQVLGVQVADIGRATSFFALGGDSISAIKAAAAMQRAGISITVPQLFKAQTVARVAALADAADAHVGQRVATEWPAAVLSDDTLAELAAVGSFVDSYPATPLQAGMVAATMQDARAYVNQVPLLATRTVSLESLRGAFRAVVQHHAILRTSFASTVAGGIVQVVRASADAAECVAVAAPLAQHLAADKARGFSLADASWIRAALVCDPAGSTQHVVVTIHHALYDGWSLPMIMRDLAAALDGHALEPRPAFRTVVDFIAAQDAAATEAFWTQQLVGLEPAQPLSLGHSARTDDEDAPLAQACSTPMAELQRAAQRAGVTVAVVLKAAWAATLRKFTRSHDVVFGEVLANRDIAVGGADRIVGPLLNTVPCRVVLDDTVLAADLVASLQAQHGAVLSHSHVALVDVQRWAGVQGDGKLFNTLFVFENLPDDGSQSGDTHKLALSGDVSSTVSSKSLSYSFELILHPSSTRVESVALFDHSHLSRSQAASILAEFDFGVQQLVTALSDKATVESLWTLSPSQQSMIARFSHGERVPLPFSLVHHGFEARAKQHPDWRAVEHGDAHLSYGDLDACGSALAATLASHGVQRGSRVAVVMQRSIEFVVALVGVLKAGATIMPVDSSFPADRIQFMLDDASVCAIVTTASEAYRIAQLSVGDRAVVVADARALLASGVSFTPAALHTATGDDNAFIVYTSGSTGKPKGVPVPHKGVVNVVLHTSPTIGCTVRSRMAQFMAIGFDACQWETWSALLSGSTLVLRQTAAFDIFASVDAVIMTPTGLSQLGDPKQYPTIKTITVTGENCPQDLKDLWASHVSFVNGGGPSEVSILGHIGQLRQGEPVVLGKVLPNYSSYILDQQQRLVPVGIVGEVHTGGPRISSGYINLPDLTAQRFVPDPFSPEPGARMFRTGDLGRLLPNGNFEILGRMDDQVKLKGYRIELDEVAAAMMRHPRVSAAAAVVKDKTHLVGFVVPADVDHDELRDVVAAALPAYMVPAVFVGLAVMPTNTNGKTDKKALAAMHVEIAVDALQTDTERALAAVWSQVLGVQVADIGRATSFFALGGDSISAIRLVAKAKQQGLTLSSALIFKAPTLAKMALAATVSETRAAVSSAPVTGSVALTPIQHMFFAHDWINISHFNQSFVVKPRDTLDIAALTAAIARLAEHHDMLRARFAQGDDGAWSQTLLPLSPQTDAANVLAVVVETDDDALACVREAQESLSITHGPLLAVRLLHMHDGSQRLFFGIHHLVVDLVSWRVLLDDLEMLLRGRPLAPKTLSFQAWAARMAAHAATLDAAPWRDLIGDHTTLLATQPPAAGVPVRAFHARAVLDDATTAQLDAANAPFNTNIQELVLAALVLSLADVAGCASSPAQLCIELEGHGREPFAADLDVSSTVGWFTSVFPVAFSASTASDIGAVVRQVKHKIRSVPLKGLSYGMIKHLAPPTADNAFVKAHGGHAVAFNYLGRFQSLEAEDAYFVADSDVGGYWSVRHEDRRFHAIELSCAHDGPRLVLSATVEDWIVSEPTMQAWLDRWQVWMQRVVAHCVDPATHGGRTVSDVPLMASQAAVEQAEAELATVLSLRARDVVDMYPVTPLQAGFLSAMMRDPSEYTVQSAFDVTGNMDVQRLRAAWHAVAMAHPIVRTVFVSTPSGLVQAVAKDDRTEWTELDGVWTADDDALQAATAALMAADRARGFSMASVSFHRFTVVRIADGRMRVFWTQHHSVSDGWSLPLLIADLMRACAGTAIAAPRAQFRDHVEWLLMQDAAASERFWRESLVHAAESGRLAPPKPRASELSGAKYGELRAVVELPRLAAVCKTHGVTVSTVLRLAWALVLRHFTRSEHIVFGSVVSGRDGSIDGIDQAVGVLINTIAVPSHLPLDASAASALVAMQSFSADAITHSHVGLVDVQRAAGVVGSDRLFDTLMVFENYPSSNAGVPLDFALTPVSSKEFVDSTVTAVFAQSENAIATHMSFECGNVPTWFAHSMMDKLIDVLRRLCSADGDFATTTVADMDALTESQQSMIARFSHGERVPLPFALVHHGFEARAKQHPDWRAVEHGDAHLSYGDLDACGSALAAALASHGVQCGSRVAVVMQRSIEFVVALVGVLKAGATIVPVDSSFPADRIQFMLDDASVCAIVTTASEAGRIAQLSVGDRAVVVADARALLASGVSFTPAAQHMATGDDDAFIVYTSGSTGKPKGVPIRHRALQTSQSRSPISDFVENALGVVGEMCLGGIGVSRGYINLPDLTAQRFVPNPFSPEPGAHMFRTGDLGRLLPDGNFEILGRMDDQVKLKGYRIELDEVAAAMMRHPRVSAAAAVVKDKTHLTDKKALAAMHIEIAVNALQTDTERALAAVWSQVLGVHVADIGRATSFFALGGDSISAIRLLKAIQHQFALPSLSHAAILKHPQLARLAAAIHAIQHPDASAESTLTFGHTKQVPTVSQSQSAVRIACFHGQGSNTIHMEHQLSSIKAALGETAEFVFIQAPHATKSSYLSEFYEGMDWFEWIPRNSQTQADVKALIAYAMQQLEKIGHVDVLLGFSQGAMVVELLDRLVQAGSIKRTWRLSVLCSGISPSSWQLPSSLATSTPHDAPSIHIFGTNEHKAFQTQLPACYAADKRAVIKHAAGHDLPRDSKFGSRVAEAIWDVMDSQVATGTIVSKKRYQKSATKSLLSSLLSCFQ